MNEVFHLYIHLPFCASRCEYCDFYSTTDALGLAPAYVESLLGELEEADACLGQLKTVYLGGGTPTLLGVELLGKLLEAVRVRTAAGAEITVEANPSTITPELAAALKEAGVNRVSLGVQSFNERLRRNLGRAGGAGAVARAVAGLRGGGIDNLGLDLIFGIPGQSLDDLKEDLRRALELAPPHLSCYELSVKEGGDYQKRWAGELEQTAKSGPRFYETVVDTLEDAGYRWYETSNFAVPGMQCRQNLAYWSGADYVGIGAGAWSTVRSKRWRNVEDVQRYAKCGGGFAGDRRQEELTTAQKTAERLLLGLRRDSGVSLAGLQAVIDPNQQNLLQRNGFLKIEGDRMYLTRAGRYVANEVCARLLLSWEDTAQTGGSGARPTP